MYMLPLWVDEVLIYGIWLGSALFAVLYTLKAAWWATPMGRNLFFFDFSMMLLATPGALKLALHINPQTEFFQWFDVAVLISVALLVIHRISLLMRAQTGWNFWGRERTAHDTDNGGLHLRGEPAAWLRGVRRLRERKLAGLRPDRGPESERLPAPDSGDVER